MSEPGGPRDHDAVYFGPESGASDDHPSGLPPDAPSPDTVDTWFSEEPEVDRPAPRFERALSAVDRHHTQVLVGLVAISVIALMVGALGWTSDRPSTVPASGLSSGDSQVLIADRAACFAFGLIDGRVADVLTPEAPIGVGRVRPFLATEIVSLDGLYAAYPGADYRLIADFANVADASVRLSNERDTGKFQELVIARATYVTRVRDACHEFFVATSIPTLAPPSA